MSTNSRPVNATAEQAWNVLSDGWLHHSVGTWPALIDDTTEVLEVEEGRRLAYVAEGRAR